MSADEPPKGHQSEKTTKNDGTFKDKEDPENELWKLLREHAAWLNQEKQIIWRRFAASLTAVSIYFAGSLVAYQNVSAFAALTFSILGLGLCVAWLVQTHQGWKLLNRRLGIVVDIQSKINAEHLKKWPLAFELRPDWMRILAVVITALFLLSFLVLAITAGVKLIREICCS